MLDEKANRFKIQFLHGEHGRIRDGHKQEGECALPGEICLQAIKLPSSRGDGICEQKSAEGIVGSSTEPKAGT
jgi:hypothetical protein